MRAFSGHPKDVGHKFPIPQWEGSGMVVVWEWASLEFPLTKYTLFASPYSSTPYFRRQIKGIRKLLNLFDPIVIVSPCSFLKS